MRMVSRALALLVALLLAGHPIAQAQPAPSAGRMGNTLWAPGGTIDVRQPVVGTQTANYNPLYTGSLLNPQGTDASTTIPFNCVAGCVTLMPRSTSAVFPPNSHVCFVNEGAGILTVGSQDNVNSPIEGAPLTSNTIRLPQYGSLCLRAKSTNHYEMVGPGVLPSGNYTWAGINKHLGPDSAAACPLTAGSTISVNLSACASDATKGIWNNSVTLSQNANINLPTGGADGQAFGLRVNHGTGPFALTFGTGFSFPSVSLSAGQPTLCSTANCADQIWCNLYNAATEADCSVSQSNLTAASLTPVYTIGAHTLSTGGCAGGVTACPSSSVNFVSTSGKAILVTVACGDSPCTGAPPNVSSYSGNVSGCSLLKRTIFSGNTLLEASLCSITSTSAGSVTANFSAASWYGQVIIVEADAATSLAPDGTIANTAGIASSTSLSVPTNGAALANDFLLAVFINGNNVAISPGVPYTQIDASTLTWGVLTEWSGTNSAGVQTATASTGTAVGWASIIVALH